MRDPGPSGRHKMLFSDEDDAPSASSLRGPPVYVDEDASASAVPRNSSFATSTSREDEVNLRSGFRLVSSFKGHNLPILQAAYTPLHDTFVTADSRSLHTWQYMSAQDGSTHRVERFEGGLSDFISCLAYFPEPGLLVAACADSTMKFYAQDQSLLCSLQSDLSSVSEMLHNEKSDEIITAGKDGVVLINYESVFGSSARLKSMRTASKVDETFRLRKVKTLIPADAGNQQSQWPACLRLDHMRQHIYVSIGHDLMIYDIVKGKMLKISRHMHNSKITCLSLFPMRRRFVTASNDGTLSAWRLRTDLVAVPSRTFSHHRKSVTGLIQLGDDEILSCGLDGVITLYSFTDNLEILATFSIGRPIRGILGAPNNPDFFFMWHDYDVNVYRRMSMYKIFASVTAPVVQCHRQLDCPGMSIIACADSTVRLVSNQHGLTEVFSVPISGTLRRLGRTQFSLKSKQIFMVSGDDFVHAARLRQKVNPARAGIELPDKISFVRCGLDRIDTANCIALFTGTLPEKSKVSGLEEVQELLQATARGSGGKSVLAEKETVFSNIIPDHYAVVGTGNGDISFYSIYRDGGLVLNRRLGSHRGDEVENLEVSPDNKFLFSSSKRQLHLHVTRITTMSVECVAKCVLRTNVTLFTTCSCSDRLIVGYDDGGVDVFYTSGLVEAPSETILEPVYKTLAAVDGAVLSLDFNIASRYYIVCGTECPLVLMTEKLVAIRRLNFGSNPYPSCAAFRDIETHGNELLLGVGNNILCIKESTYMMNDSTVNMDIFVRASGEERLMMKLRSRPTTRELLDNFLHPKIRQKFAPIPVNKILPSLGGFQEELHMKYATEEHAIDGVRRGDSSSKHDTEQFQILDLFEDTDTESESDPVSDLEMRVRRIFASKSSSAYVPGSEFKKDKNTKKKKKKKKKKRPILPSKSASENSKSVENNSPWQDVNLKPEERRLAPKKPPRRKNDDFAAPLPMNTRKIKTPAVSVGLREYEYQQALERRLPDIVSSGARSLAAITAGSTNKLV